MNVMQEIVQELKQSEELLEEEKGHIQFLLEQIKDDTSLKDMIRILQDNKTLKQQLKTTRFIRFFFFFIGVICFIISVLLVYKMDLNRYPININLIFKSIFFFLTTVYFLYKMSEYNQQLHKLALEKRSLEKIADILKMIEKSKINLSGQEEIIIKILNELLKVQIKNIHY